MKAKGQYSLDEAIKKFCITEPLKIDLAKTVSDRVFLEEREVSFAFDKVLYFVIGLITIGIIIYCFTLFSKISMSFVVLFLIIGVGFWGLSVKEYTVLSKKVLNYQ